MHCLQERWRRYAVGAALAAVGVVTLSAPVLAAERTPAWNWSGFYFGVNAGWGWGEETGERTADAGLAAVIGAVPISYRVRPEGLFGGGQAGYNWQSGMWVYGFEADLQASNIHESLTVNLPTGAITAPSINNATERLEWFGTVRARLGIAPSERALYFMTGGFAYGRVESRADVCFPLFNGVCDGFFSGGVKDTRTGWTVGGGAEYALDHNWALKIEYLYLDLGSDTFRLTDPINPGSFLDYRFEHRDHIARIGLNYRPR